MGNVGFIGLGIMGEAMCRNLMRKGHAVVIYNRTPGKTGALAGEGAVVASSPADVAARSDVVVTMLSNPDAVRAVYGGPAGIAAIPLGGKCCIDMSTVSPECSRETAAAVAGAGGEFLEAPVLGSRKPAEAGTLTILTGGDAALSGRFEPLLLAMGSKVVHMGGIGAAAHMKLIVNQLMGTILCVFGEAALTGLAAGIPAEKIIEVVMGSAAASPVIGLKGPDMLGPRLFDTHFPLKHALKDMKLAVLAGDAMGVPTPVTAAAQQLFASARERGFGDRDLSAVLRALTGK
jgi:3-hydroxyisobutyrate dehydrogenase-like beta-hydroxyacid dehydrogenase